MQVKCNSQGWEKCFEMDLELGEFFKPTLKHIHTPKGPTQKMSTGQAMEDSMLAPVENGGLSHYRTSTSLWLVKDFATIHRLQIT